MAKNNIITLIGNLGKEPKLIETKSNRFVAFSLATKDSYKDKTTNEWMQKETTWHDVIVFKPSLIDKASKLSKGERVTIEGSIAYRSFKATDSKGNEVTKREASIIAEKVEISKLAKKD